MENLATIQTGCTFRSQWESSPDGEVSVLQMRDLVADEFTDEGTMDRMHSEETKESHQVQPEDVIFRSRGSKMGSVFVARCPANTILSAPLFRIRVNSPDVLPRYLNWYLNQAAAQLYLERVTEGSAQKMVSRQSLASLPVEVPSLEIQGLVVKVVDLSRRETGIIFDIAAKQQQIVTAQLARAIQQREEK